MESRRESRKSRMTLISAQNVIDELGDIAHLMQHEKDKTEKCDSPQPKLF